MKRVLFFLSAVLVALSIYAAEYTVYLTVVTVDEYYYYNNGAYAYSLPVETKQAQQIVNASTESQARSLANSMCSTYCRNDGGTRTETVDGVKYTVKRKTNATVNSTVKSN